MPTDSQNNPLLDLEQLPRFSLIKPEHVVPAVERLLAEGRAVIAALPGADDAPTFETLVAPQEIADDRLNRAWSPVGHLHSVKDSPALRDAYNACLPLLSDYATEVNQNERLFHAYEVLAARPDFAALPRAERRIVDNALREFRLGGVHLGAEAKQRFGEIASRLSALSSRFQENALDATQAWTRLVTDPADLAGLPDSALALARQSATRKGLEGWLLTLEFPSYLPVMSYADNRALRREIYEAYVTRASDRGPHAGRFDNSEVMQEILALRHEKALLLGFANYAEYSLARKMAKSTGQVTEFLLDLSRRSRPMAEHELDELRDFAREACGLETLEAWDFSYASEKLRQRSFNISQETLRPWFPVPRVLGGLFAIVERLYGVLIEESDGVDVWHPDVRFYRIRGADGLPLGCFYLDLYAREGKRGGAWMDECVVRRRLADGVQQPVAYLTCNFTPPVDGRPSLLTHDDVTTLFHEFGHGLHHMLTQVDYPSVSGINGVAWDAVELPSQLMEHWCWEREAVQLYSGHHETGEPLPEELFERLHAARNFQSAMQMARQIEFSLFDFRVHLEFETGSKTDIAALLDDVRERVSVLRPPEWNRFAHGFSHVFAGGYAAGYYSYKWAEVLASDAFSMFEERGIFDRDTGRAFLGSVLEQGGTRDAMDLFVEFRGREPSIDALLRHCGLAETPREETPA